MSGLFSHRKVYERRGILARIGGHASAQVVPFPFAAALAVTAGFFALAIAVPIEPQVPAPLIALLSPGLKLAELVMPETHKSMAWTFGWFLRIAIAANAAFYFGIFVMMAYLADRSRSK
jgi:hypothetical protein